MRQGQQNRRGRGRNRKAHHNPLTRSYESNGPDVKIRGTPAHIAEKYMALARDALASGDPVLAENYLQHAEHYNRIIMAYREQTAQQAGEQMNGFNRHRNDILTDVDDFSDEDTEEEELLSPVEPDVQPRADVQLRTDEPRPRQLQDQIHPRTNGENGGRERFQEQRNGQEYRNNGASAERQAQAVEQPEAEQPVMEPVAQPSRSEAATRRRDRFGGTEQPQPEFLRRPVRRGRRETNGGSAEAGEAASAAKEDNGK